MCYVYHEDCTDFVGELADACIVPLAAVCARAGNDELRTLCACLLFHLLIVHPACLFVYSVADRLEHETGEVHRATVAEVTAVAEVHTHELVAGLEAGHEHCHVCLGAAVGLHVGPLCSEEFLGTLDGEVLSLVNNLATAVVTLCRVSLGIFVCEARAHGAHHLVTHEVLAGDKFDAATLAQMLTVNDVKDFVVSFHDILVLI